MIKANKLTKEEKVKSAQRVSEIYHEGTAGFVYPFKYHFILEPKEDSFQNLLRLCIAVSKKKFKHAVDRNRVKRLVKEAFRLNKMAYYDTIGHPNSIDLYLVFIGKELPDYATIEKGMKTILDKLTKLANNAEVKSLINTIGPIKSNLQE